MSRIDAQVSTFTRCYGELARAKDPNVTPPGCTAPAEGSGSAVGSAVGAAALSARATTFTDSETRSLFLPVGLFGLTFLLVLLLPQAKRQSHELGELAA